MQESTIECGPNVSQPNFMENTLSHSQDTPNLKQ